MSDTVSLKIKIEGDDTLRTVTASASELAVAINKVQDETTRLKAEFVNLASISQIMEGVSSAVGQLQGMFSELTAAYSVQVAAETRLAQAMRNTMGATAEEIQSIMDLCSAQQQTGIVGDEVQLSAAQELATYLEFSDSLKTLIPVMNDMVAQQLSLGASGESAAQIASMLGKVMNGQTEALSRYGYKFDEAQKYILKFGEESERAAVLVDVISESVGGMNEAMGATDVGKMQFVANAIGDVKEVVGGAVQAAMPLVSVLAEVTMAASGIMRLAQAFRALHLQNLLVKASSVAAAAAQRMQAAAAKILGVSQLSAATATGALKVQIVALQAAMTMGLSVAITGLVTLLGRLAGKAGEAASAVEETDDAVQAYGDASHQAMMEVAGEIVELEKLIRSKGEEGKKVAELNARYGDAFGCFSTAAEWYDTLTSRSADYCRQLGYEAKAKVLAARSGEKQVQLDDLRRQISAMEESGPQQRTVTKSRVLFGGSVEKWEETTDYGRLKEQEEALAAEIGDVTAEFGRCIDAARTAADAVRSSADDGTAAVSGESAATGRLAEDIARFRADVEGAAQANSVFGTSASDTEARLSAMRSGITSLISKYGTESESIQKLITEYRELLQAQKAANGTLVKPEVTVPVKYTVEELKGGEWQEVLKTSAVSMQGTLQLTTRPKGQKSQRRQAEELYEKLKGMLPDASDFEAEGITNAMKKLKELYNLQNDGNGKMHDAADGVHALSSAMGALSGCVDGAAASWLSWGANLLSVIGQALPALSTLFAANTAVSGSEAARSVAGIPIVGPVLAVAAIASITAALMSLPKFAEGGLAYGPTLGLFGEYPGASGNPEVVAPLSDLTGILAGAGFGGGKVEFVIDGRRLVGVLNKTDRYYGRSGQ